VLEAEESGIVLFIDSGTIVPVGTVLDEVRIYVREVIDTCGTYAGEGLGDKCIKCRRNGKKTSFKFASSSSRFSCDICVKNGWACVRKVEGGFIVYPYYNAVGGALVWLNVT
jgi:hypothetical protein